MPTRFGVSERATTPNRERSASTPPWRRDRSTTRGTTPDPRPPRAAIRPARPACRTRLLTTDARLALREVVDRGDGERKRDCAEM
jgi:hypothetical protein